MTNAKGNRGWAAVMVAILMMLAAAVAAPAQTFKLLVSFDVTNGTNSHAGLVQGTDGNLYGTTVNGGTSNACIGTCGTVFKITPTGTLTTLHNFQGTDGGNPQASLTLSSDGTFYGTTQEGGVYDYGTVFKMLSNGTLVTLHSFDGTDGSGLVGPLLQASDGSFYGTAAGGIYGDGTIFKVTSAGAFTTVHNFRGSDGDAPTAGLVQATDGNFYGITDGNNTGTVFKMTPAGVLTTLYSFGYGINPRGGLIQATDGNLYGTTVFGGANGAGTLFRLTLGGTLTTLYSFNTAEGYEPYDNLIQGTDGNLYGTTLYSGSGDTCITGGCGSIFTSTLDGAVTFLHYFSRTQGSYPIAGLFQATNGGFYGTTESGGANGPPYGDGTVFALSVGLGPFVETVPPSGKVGDTIKILGNNLTGATSVTFNGTPATYSIHSGYLIEAPVPTGATTGLVQVVTQSSTLTSNVNFQVLP